MPRNPFLDQVPAQEFPLVSYYLQDKLGTGGGSSSTSASYADTASYTPGAVITASAIRGGDIINFVKGDGSTFEVAVTASNATSASYALTASYAMNGGSGNTFPYTGSALITGSLGITGSLNVSQSLDTANKLLYDNNGVGTVDWTNLILSDNSNIQSVVWGERTLNDLGGVISLNWADRQLIGPGGSVNLDWSIDNSISVQKLTVSGLLTSLANITTTGNISASQGFTGSLFGTASWANSAINATRATSASYADTASFIRTAQTASYVLQAVSASFASTASYVNTLNQNVLITGSLTVGATTAGASENTLTLGPKGTNEGGQLLLQAGTSYTSASMIDVYADTGNNNQYVRILRGSNAGSDAVVAQFNMHTKQASFPAYNSSTAFTGTPTAYLAVDNNGNLLTTTGSGTSGLSGGSANYIARWASSIILTTGSLWDNGTNVGVGNQSPSYKLDVSGDIRSTGAVYANANNTMYFRGGDDAEFWDINTENTVGIYGQQNQGVASIKLGSGGGTISGRSGSIGINTTTPNSGALHINGGVFATSFTGSLQGTSSWAVNALTASYVANASSFPFTGSAIITGSLTVTGSIRGYVVDITPTNQTASLNCALGNMFTLTLSGSTNTLLTASNIQPGQAINLRIVQPNPSGSLSYGSQFKFSSGFAYTASATSSVTDIVSFLTFDTSSLFGTSIRNFV